jgi:hypothetical protein
VNWVAKIKSSGLRPGTPLLLCEPQGNRAGQDGELKQGDTISFMTPAGAIVLVVARASKHEIIVENVDGGTWRLGPTIGGEARSGSVHTGKSSEWTIRARSG